MSSQFEQLHAIVRGEVQGVNFRSSTRSQASWLGLVGWVRNRPDGTVEVLAEGPRAALDRLLAFLEQGPPAAQVTQVKPTWGAATNAFRQFDITW